MIISFFRTLSARLSGLRRTPSAPRTGGAVHLDRKLIYALNRKKVPGLRQLRHLPKVLSATERRLSRGLFVLLGVSTIGLGLLYYAANFQTIPAPGGDYTEGLIGAPRFINPLLAQTNDVDTDLARLIFAGLLRYDSNLQLVPDLADRWEASEDAKTYTFFLKPNLTWHDGAGLTAQDVVFTIQSIQDPEFKSPLFISFRGVTSEAIDDHTIKFTLTEAYPQFLDALTVGILPEHIWVESPAVNSNLSEYNLKPVGSGPWQFKGFIKDKQIGNIKSITLEPFSGYIGQRPYIETLIFKFYPDFETAIAALKNHSVEGISFVPKHLKNEIDARPHLNLYSFPLPQFTAIFFNQKENEALKDKQVRQALAHAIDKNALVTEALQLEGRVIHGPLFPDAAGDADETTMAYDTQKANELLDAAGWKSITPDEYAALTAVPATSTASTTDVATSPAETAPVETELIPGESTDLTTLTSYRKKGDVVLNITLTVVNQPESLTVAKLIEEAWAKLGVLTTLDIIEPSRIAREVIKPRNYQALLFGEIVGPDADPYPFWHSSQNQDPGLNLAVFANRQADKLLEEAQAAKTPEEKAAKYKEFASIITTEVPAIFLYMPTYTYAVNEKVKGIRADRVLLPADRFNTLSEWYINTRSVYRGTENH